MDAVTTFYGALLAATVWGCAIAHRKERERACDCLFASLVVAAVWVVTVLGFYFLAYQDRLYVACALDAAAGAVIILHGPIKAWKLAIVASYFAQGWLSTLMPEHPSPETSYWHDLKENALFVVQLGLVLWGGWGSLALRSASDLFASPAERDLSALNRLGEE
jgi:hypothetical protein